MRIQKHVIPAAAALVSLLSLTSCGQPVAAPSAHHLVQSGAYVAHPLPKFYRILGTEYDASNKTVTVHVKRLYTGPVTPHALHKIGGEKTIDSADVSGVINFATAEYPREEIRRVRVLDHSLGWNYSRTAPHSGGVRTELRAGGNPTKTASVATGTVDTNGAQTVADVPVPSTTGSSTTTQSPSGQTSGQSSSIPLPPHGVRIDPNISPRAGLTAPATAKVLALKQIAQSKLGTPYIWGHNEDRGQYGFDCSNFTEYVYHHALGYLFTTSSKGQYLYVGDRVPVSSMQPGDLLAFDAGAHVGIYLGHGEMIQEGGGLHKVGYLPVYPGSYWYNHLSAVKRMF
ncbi:C40 family peptidase [Sulfoacidibacillus thermotolerans]|uniref:C40 family peptidase n=1 Tax=Sulfoacidibacillus thermotolerans TaxID=1765684 RepID=UPI001FE3DF5C|nr:C40 family peptidase [Sulfoacidibacillus thermotolerans]